MLTGKLKKPKADRKPAVATDIRFKNGHLIVSLNDGREISVPLGFYPTLAKATAGQRSQWELIGGGRGICWDSLEFGSFGAGVVGGCPEKAFPSHRFHQGGRHEIPSRHAACMRCLRQHHRPQRHVLQMPELRKFHGMQFKRAPMQSAAPGGRKAAGGFRSTLRCTAWQRTTRSRNEIGTGGNQSSRRAERATIHRRRLIGLSSHVDLSQFDRNALAREASEIIKAMIEKDPRFRSGLPCDVPFSYHSKVAGTTLSVSMRSTFVSELERRMSVPPPDAQERIMAATGLPEMTPEEQRLFQEASKKFHVFTNGFMARHSATEFRLTGHILSSNTCWLRR